MSNDRRIFLQRALWTCAGLATAGAQPALAAVPQKGGSLIVAQSPEPPVLTSALTTAGPTQWVSAKIFDGLLRYGPNLEPLPGLATRWQQSADHLSLTFELRPDVRWHDGQPFTSADVAFSLLEVWKRYHSRGRSTFANVIAVDTPTSTTAVLRLSKPAPYILSALMSVESQVIPKHRYAGTDILNNPLNNAPIGTGPFRFKNWARGSHITLERNPDYWHAGKPHLDEIVFQIMPEPGGVAAALETGSIHVAPGMNVPQNSIAQLSREPSLTLVKNGADFAVGLDAFEFNLDRPQFRDPRVRQAIAHMIDRDFIVKNILFGYGVAAQAPIPPQMTTFYTDQVPHYPHDPQRAQALLDAAGFPRGADGTRLSFTHDMLPSGGFPQTAQFIRASLARIGVRMDIRPTDYGEFVNRVYTRRDFDTTLYGATVGPDPAIGTQRFYWSSDFQPGVAFSNGAHYRNPEVDRLLEAAQTETATEKRRALYDKFQAIAQTDLPRIPIVSGTTVLLTNRRVRNAVTTLDGFYGNYADTTISAA
jgi:peptide/nickel transport system substrate-binding protein